MKNLNKNEETKIKNIKTGYGTQVFAVKRTDDILVRFYNGFLGRYEYVPEGTKVRWEEEYREVWKTISKKNSKEYKIKARETPNLKPTGNHDIDHYLITECEKILAITVIGDTYFEVSKKEYENDKIDW